MRCADDPLGRLRTVAVAQIRCGTYGKAATSESGRLHGLIDALRMALVWVLAGVVPARRRIYPLVLVSILVALIPLADASPPDPTWLTGIYDGADFDEVVAAVVSATAVVSGIFPLCPKAADLRVRAWPKNAVLLVAARCSAFTIRAPPSSTRIVTCRSPLGARRSS